MRRSEQKESVSDDDCSTLVWSCTELLSQIQEQLMPECFWSVGRIEVPNKFTGNHSVLDYIYKIEIDGITVVYTGDTRKIDLSTFAKNADYLFHEAGEIDPSPANLKSIDN